MGRIPGWERKRISSKEEEIRKSNLGRWKITAIVAAVALAMALIGIVGAVFNLVAQDNSMVQIDNGPPFDNNYALKKTLNFNLANSSALRVDFNLSQFHFGSHHLNTNLRVRVDGNIEIDHSHFWVIGGPGTADTHSVVLPGPYAAGAHTATLELADAGRNTLFEISAQPVSVGGTTSFLESSSGSSYGYIALLAGSVAAVVAIVAGGWYTRRRWLRS